VIPRLFFGIFNAFFRFPQRSCPQKGKKWADIFRFPQKKSVFLV
jgi:hypothetical protein